MIGQALNRVLNKRCFKCKTFPLLFDEGSKFHAIRSNNLSNSTNGNKKSEKLKKVSVTRVIDTNQMQTRLLMGWGLSVAADKVKSILLGKDVLEFIAKDPKLVDGWKAKVESISKSIIQAPEERSVIERNNGSRIHEIIENWLEKGQINENDSLKDAISVQYAVKSFSSYMKSLGLSRFKFVEFEVRVESEKYGLKGIIDAIARDTKTNELVIFDWKTGKSVYLSNALQLAAYAKMYEETRKEKISKAYILRISKEEVDWELNEISIEDSFSVFKAALLTYYSQEATLMNDSKALYKIISKSKDTNPTPDIEKKA